MNKVLILLVTILAVVLIGGAVFAGWYVQNNSYKNKDAELNTQIAQKTSEVESLKAAKDTNGYSPKEIATNFLNEFKNGSDVKAKLYLAKEMQSTDLKKALNVAEPAKLTVTEVVEKVSDDVATATAAGYVGTETTVFNKVFSLIKESGLWKISQIK